MTTPHKPNICSDCKWHEFKETQTIDEYRASIHDAGAIGHICRGKTNPVTGVTIITQCSINRRKVWSMFSKYSEFCGEEGRNFKPKDA